jgi:putative FmdB family regulatory protein
MPTYSYICEKCKSNFELFFYIKDYTEKPSCPKCLSNQTLRNYLEDILTQNTSIKQLDSELKTLGDLANRNRDRLSEDEKISLHKKHNNYKENKPDKPLPKGMSRIKKEPKTKWT